MKKIEKKMLLCPLLGVFLAMSLNILIATINLDRIFPSYSTEMKPWLFRLPLLTGLLVYGVLAPIVEELIFRWLFFRKLCVYFIAPAAGVGSAFIFGIYHGNALQFIYAFIFGIILAYVYWRFENILSSIMVHGAANAYGYIMYFLPVSGVFSSMGIRILLILASGVVSILIMMYFISTSPGRSVLPEKPFFPTKNT